MTAPLSANEIWRATAASFARARSDYLTLAAAFTLLPAMFAEVLGPAVTLTAAVGTSLIVWQIILLLLGMVAQLAIQRMVLCGEPPRAALVAAFPKVPTLFLASLLAAVMMLPATMLIVGSMRGQPPLLLPGLVLLIPALYAVARLSLAAPMIGARGLGPVAALRASWRATTANGWRILGVLAGLLATLLVIGLVARGIGAALGSVLTLLGTKEGGGFVAALISTAVASGYTAVNAIALAVLHKRLS